MVYVIPQLGVITDALRPPTNYILIGLILVVLIYYLRNKNQEVSSANVGGGGKTDNFGSTGTGEETGYTSTTDTGDSGSGVETDNRKANGGNTVGKEGS